MGKKGNKSSKKKGKKAGGGNKGGQREDQITVQEAFMALNIKRKEKVVEDLMLQVTNLRERNRRYQDRNVRLKEEQEVHIKVLLRQVKEYEAEAEKRGVFTCAHVEKTLRDLWEAGQLEDQQLRDLKIKIKNSEIEYANVLSQVELWREYRDSGAKQHADQIKLLQLDLEDMGRNFEDVCKHLKKQLDVAKSEAKSDMEQCMAEQQHLASEKAMKQMDVQGLQEIHENEWLKKETDIHRKESAILRSFVEVLEAENIQLINNLVDCQDMDLKIDRSFMNIDLSGESTSDNLSDRQLVPVNPQEPETPNKNPIPITSEAESSDIEGHNLLVKPDSPNDDDHSQQQNVLAIQAGQHNSWNQQALERNILERGQETEQFLEQQVEEGNILEQQQYLHLGPFEVKLLFVKGEAKPIHNIDSHLDEGALSFQQWPISASMLRTVQSSP